METSEQLIDEIKVFIIESLNLEDIEPSEIDSQAPLFGEGLALDSIDALELGVALAKRYGVTVDANSEDAHKHFSSVESLAALVASTRNL